MWFCACCWPHAGPLLVVTQNSQAAPERACPRLAPRLCPWNRWAEVCRHHPAFEGERGVRPAPEASGSHGQESREKWALGLLSSFLCALLNSIFTSLLLLYLSLTIYHPYALSHLCPPPNSPRSPQPAPSESVLPCVGSVSSLDSTYERDVGIVTSKCTLLGSVRTARSVQCAV